MKNKTLLIMFILLLFSHLITASELPSRPFLGVAGSNSASNTHGALIDRVFPGGTGESLKLQTGDLITSINSIEITSFNNLVENLKNMSFGEKIELNVIRNNKLIQLIGQLKSRPKETVKANSSFDILYDSVNYQNNQLRSIIYRPKLANSKLKFPAVYFVQGYTCASIDYGLFPDSTSQQLLESIAEAGYVVYKIEKFGVGDSIGDLKCLEIDFTTELAGFNAGLEALKSYEFVDEDQIHLFGHSLGGVYAPFIAEHSPIKSLISYGSVVKSWHDYLLDIYSKQALIFGTSKQQALINRNLVAPLLKAWLKSDQSWSDIITSKDLNAAISSDLIPISGDQVFNRHYSFFRDLNGYDLGAAWKNTKSHVLAIHGSLDIQAIDDSWATQMASLPKKEGLKSESVVLEGAEHGFMKYDSMADYLKARNDRRYNPSQPGSFYDPRIAKTIIKWLGSLSTST
jgi:dienelactone hydrolase